MAWFLWARNCLQRNDNDKEMTHEQTAMASSWMELLPCWDRLASTTYSNEESTVATDKCNKERVLIRWACREVKVKVLVTQLCPTLRDPMDCSPPGFSIQGILQARIREWVAISFSRGIFPTQGWNLGLLHCRQILYHLSHPIVRVLAHSRGSLSSWNFLHGPMKQEQSTRRNQGMGSVSKLLKVARRAPGTTATGTLFTVLCGQILLRLPVTIRI